MAGRAQSWDQLRETPLPPADPGPGGLSPPPPKFRYCDLTFIPVLSLRLLTWGATVWVPQSRVPEKCPRGRWPGEGGRALSCALSTSSDCPVIGESLLLKQSEPPCKTMDIRTGSSSHSRLCDCQKFSVVLSLKVNGKKTPYKYKFLNFN